MLDIRSTIPEAGAWRPLSVLAVAVMTIVVACSDGESATVATAAPTDADAVEEPAAEDAQVDASPADEAGADEAGPELDFGSGTGSITLGDETFELAIGPGTGLCRDVFGIIQAGGQVTDGRDIQGDFAIPPLDWESYDDGRYDPPSVELEITSTGDDNARWRADAGWAAENGLEGSSQVDSYEKDGLTASGTATFANAWNPDDEAIQGSFEISCEA